VRSECARSADCSLRALWRTLHHALRTTLEAVSLEDLLRDERAMTVWLDDGGPVAGAFRDAFPKEVPHAAE
jgi:DNA-binding IscR family transcriptional regulator